MEQDAADQEGHIPGREQILFVGKRFFRQRISGDELTRKLQHSVEMGNAVQGVVWEKVRVLGKDGLDICCELKDRGQPCAFLVFVGQSGSQTLGDVDL